MFSYHRTYKHWYSLLFSLLRIRFLHQWEGLLKKLNFNFFPGSLIEPIDTILLCFPHSFYFTNYFSLLSARLSLIIHRQITVFLNNMHKPVGALWCNQSKSEIKNFFTDCFCRLPTTEFKILTRLSVCSRYLSVIPYYCTKQCPFLGILLRSKHLKFCNSCKFSFW